VSLKVHKSRIAPKSPLSILEQTPQAEDLGSYEHPNETLPILICPFSPLISELLDFPLGDEEIA
jgi:hypothetical protein